jgi:hypothetical protein
MRDQEAVSPAVSSGTADRLWVQLGSPKTLGAILAALAMGWWLTWLIPQMPSSVWGQAALAEQWLSRQQAAMGTWGSLYRLFGLFDICHALWFTLLWAALAASLVVGLADIVVDILGLVPVGRIKQRGALVTAAALLFYVGALFAVAGVYWGDQRGWSMQVSLAPGQSQAIDHGSPYVLRFDRFEELPATSGPGRELRGRLSLMTDDGTVASKVLFSARHPLRYEQLRVRPVWFGRRVDLRVRGAGGVMLPLRVSGGETADEVGLFFGRDSVREVQFAEHWRLGVDVRLDEGPIGLTLWDAGQPTAVRVAEERVSPPAVIRMGDFRVAVGSETYVTLEVRYMPGRWLAWGGLAAAAIGLCGLLLSAAVRTFGVGSGTPATTAD